MAKAAKDPFVGESPIAGYDAGEKKEHKIRLAKKYNASLRDFGAFIERNLVAPRDIDDERIARR